MTSLVNSTEEVKNFHQSFSNSSQKQKRTKHIQRTSQGVLVVQNSATSVVDMSLRFDPWIGEIPWRRVWQPTLVFLPEESHGQRILAGYSPQGCKKLGVTEATQYTYKHIQTHFMRLALAWKQNQKWAVQYNKITVQQP